MRELSREDLRSCCASARWGEEVAARGPYRDLDGLRRASGPALAALAWDDVLEALAAHPRIGERPGGAGREAAWSRSEQSGAGGAGLDVLDALREGNAAYESRFGHVYLVCATGRDADDLLAVLRGRLGNDEETERGVVRDELSKIVALRLATLWEGP